MPCVKFIHTADLHLDTPFKGLSHYNKELAAKVKEATFKAFESIIDNCITEAVDFLIIAGDVFDKESKSLGAQVRFIEQMLRLFRNNIDVYLICGNHDPLSSWIPTLDLPPNVHRFGSSQIQKFTYSRNGEPLVDLYGISFQDKAITENISLRYKVEEASSPFTIALLHGNLTSNKTHGNYAPFSLSNLQDTSFDYWALGHIHLSQVLQQNKPAIVYPGNPQGRDFGEQGSKGCYLVELRPAEDPRLTFLPTHLIRFQELYIDLTGANQLSQLIKFVRDGIEKACANDNLIIRLTVTGRTALHKQLMSQEDQLSILEELNHDAFRIEPFSFIDSLHIYTQSELDIDELRNAGDFTSEIIQEFDRIHNDPALLETLLNESASEMGNTYVKREVGALSDKDKKVILDMARYKLLDKFISE